ncbi:MAG: PHP-associated domain-containing protein [Desulfomonilaceae bacterium]
MKIDLHIHTTAYSPCSVMSPDQLMTAALRAGLDGVCITEHHVVWPRDEADALSRKYGLAVFRGVEITTTGGDILVYGIEEAPKGMLTPAQLKSIVEAQDGLCVAAHPFRGFLLFGFGRLQLDAQSAANNPTFSQVHGIEVCNGMVTDDENNLAKTVADALGLIKVGGSDAHIAKAVGTCVTDFLHKVKDERDLINALRSGQFSVHKMK